MENNITYYIVLLVMVIIGIVVVKKIAGCLFKSVHYYPDSHYGRSVVVLYQRRSNPAATVSP